MNVQASKTVRASWTLLATVLNIADARYLLDDSNTFGDTHYNSPRQVSVGAKCRFHYQIRLH